MAIEFVVFDAQGKEIDWIDPYNIHQEVAPGRHKVDNGWGVYEVEIEPGGRYEIRRRLGDDA